MARVRNYTGTVEATALQVSTGNYNNLVLTIDEQTATTGTVTVTVIPPNLSESVAPASNVYTVGSSEFVQALNLPFVSVVLTPATVDAEMSYNLAVWE